MLLLFLMYMYAQRKYEGVLVFLCSWFLALSSCCLVQTKRKETKNTNKILSAVGTVYFANATKALALSVE